jgi:DNA polymerase-3 subunit beta
MAKPTAPKLLLELVAPRRDLLSAIDAALPACATSGAQPILHSLQVTAKASGKVTITGSDIILSCASSLIAEVKIPGSVCLPAKLLRDVVARMKEGPLTIAWNGSSTSVKGAGARRADGLSSIPGEDFPTIPTPQGEPVIVPAATLFAVLKSTRASMSADDTRPHLAATFLKVREGSVIAVSTDGHRLTSIPARAESLSGNLPDILIPRVFLDRVKLPQEGDLSLWCARKEGPLFLKHGDTVWTTKLVDAAFPSYEQVVPSSWDMTVTVDRAALADAINAVMTVSSDRTSGVKLRAKGETLTLTSENPDRGEMADEVPCEIEGKAEVFIGMNGRYVLDALAPLTGEQVMLRFSGELDPMLVHDATMPGMTVVVMSMRI